MFIEIERITTTTYIKDINLIDTNMMGPHHTCAVDDVGEMQCWGRNMNYEGPRNVNYNNWIAPQRTVEDQYYATSPFPGTCERLITTRIDFKTRVNGSLSKFNINVFSRLLVSCLLFFYLS